MTASNDKGKRMNVTTRVSRGAALSCAAVLFLAACGSGGGGNAGSSNSPAQVKFAVLTNNPSCTDYSFGQAVCDGANAAAKATGAKLTFAPNLASADDISHQAAAYANAGYKAIFIADGAVPDVVAQLAQQFPNTFFCEGFTAISPMPKNVCTWNVDFGLGTFSAGVLAGMLTKTNKVGGITSADFAVIDNELESFILGARYVNPKVTSVETNINTSTNVSEGEAAANAQIAAGADMIVSAADATNPGLFKAAQAHPGTLIFPQYTDSAVLAPGVILTTALDDLGGCIEMVIKLGVSGTLKNQNYFCGAVDGAGKLAPFTPQLADLVTPAIQARFDAIQAMLLSGQLALPTFTKLGQAQSYDLSLLPPAPPLS